MERTKKQKQNNTHYGKKEKYPPSPSNFDTQNIKNLYPPIQE